MDLVYFLLFCLTEELPLQLFMYCHQCTFSQVLWVHVFFIQMYSHECTKLNYCIRYSFSQLRIWVTLCKRLMYLVLKNKVLIDMKLLLFCLCRKNFAECKPKLNTLRSFNTTLPFEEYSEK